MPKKKKKKKPQKSKLARVFNTLFKKQDLTDSSDPRRFIGRTVLASREIGGDPEEVQISHVLGNLKNLKYFEINGSHFCHMYSYFCQLEENRLPTKEELDEFELATQIKDIKPIKENIYGKSKEIGSVVPISSKAPE